MRLRLIWVGKTRDAHLRALVGEYLKRLSRFVRCEVTELRESRSEEHTSELQSRQYLECRLLLEKNAAARTASGNSCRAAAQRELTASRPSRSPPSRSGALPVSTRSGQTRSASH